MTNDFNPLTVIEATRLLGFDTPQYTYLLLRAGTLRGRKLMNQWTIDPDSITEYLANHRPYRTRTGVKGN
jgi:hypothetical protein